MFRWNFYALRFDLCHSISNFFPVDMIFELLMSSQHSLYFKFTKYINSGCLGILREREIDWLALRLTNTVRVTKFCRLFVNASWIKFDASDLDIYVHSIAFSYRDDKRAGAQTKRVCLDQFEFKNFQLRRGVTWRWDKCTLSNDNAV